jgi:2-alkyl-3-oxoalkanoate reductase
MRVFIAGASGALGRRLVAQLIARGHRIIGTTRTQAKLEDLREAGAEPMLLDALDEAAVFEAVRKAEPDVVVHQMTSLARMRDLKRFDRELEATNRLRTDGTRRLLAASRAAGVTHFVAQSYTGWPNERRGGRVKSEPDPLDPDPPKCMRRSLEAIRTLETLVTDAGGIVLRYGSFYGPGTALGPGGAIFEAVRRRRLPLIGNGAGVWSFIHIDDAAMATVAAIEGAPPSGIYNVVDDDPAEVSIWLPALAEILGAKPPRRIPVWLARLIVGEAGVSMMTQIRGSSNTKAKGLFGWLPMYSSWRDGFEKETRATQAPDVSLKQSSAASKRFG